MAKTNTEQKTATAEDKKNDAPSVQEAKSTTGVNAGSDEVGSLAEVEEAQNSEPTPEPAAAFSSGVTAEAEAKRQRAIREEDERMRKLNEQKQTAAKGEETVAASYKKRIETLERKVDALTQYIVRKEEGRSTPADVDVLRETE